MGSKRARLIVLSLFSLVLFYSIFSIKFNFFGKADASSKDREENLAKVSEGLVSIKVMNSKSADNHPLLSTVGLFICSDSKCENILVGRNVKNIVDINGGGGESGGVVVVAHFPNGIDLELTETISTSVMSVYKISTPLTKDLPIKFLSGTTEISANTKLYGFKGGELFDYSTIQSFDDSKEYFRFMNIDKTIPDVNATNPAGSDVNKDTITENNPFLFDENGICVGMVGRIENGEKPLGVVCMTSITKTFKDFGVPYKGYVLTNKDDLKSAIDSCSDVKKSRYTKDSYETFDGVLSDAKKIYDNEESNQESVDAVLSDLKIAKDSLQYDLKIFIVIGVCLLCVAVVLFAVYFVRAKISKNKEKDSQREARLKKFDETLRNESKQDSDAFCIQDLSKIV